MYFGYNKDRFIIFREKEILTRKNEYLDNSLLIWRLDGYYPVFVAYRREPKICNNDNNNNNGFDYKKEGFDEFYNELCNYYSLDNILMNEYKQAIDKPQ